MTTTGPTIGKITRRNGIAGEYQITAEVTYPNEPTEVHTFFGSVYGGPIATVFPNGRQLFISRAVQDRIGSMLSADWVRAYFAPREV